MNSPIFYILVSTTVISFACVPGYNKNTVGLGGSI